MAGDHLITALKAARQAKGLSQRALAARVGLPQSHISKIENGGVDLQLSSLVELARALELEVTLVPRKAVPAVESIVRQTTRQQAHVHEGPSRVFAAPGRPAHRLDEEDDNG